MTMFTDIAIIGGGVSGLYAGMRMAETPQYSGKRITLFEASSRLGGRIFSIQNPELSLPCELGCMRYLKSQPLMRYLIEDRYQLTVQPFDTGKVERHIYHMRGQWLTPQTWEQAPYGVSTRFGTKNPFQILDQIINEVKHHHFSKSPSQNAQEENVAALKKEITYPFKGRLYSQPLWKLGFANLITESSNDETLKWISDSGEYYAKTINWNASEAFPYSQTVGYKAKDDIEYWCVKDGFSSLCHHLNASFLQQGGVVNLGMALKSIERNLDATEGTYRLILEDIQNQRTQVVLCNRVILALPKQALEKIRFSSFFGVSQLNALLQSVRILPVVRLALLFKRPWWQDDFDGLNGHMVTDLPIRHGYYFGSSVSNEYSVFLSTIDMHMTDYWYPYLKSDTLSSSLSDAAISEILRQLKIIHQKETIESPVVAFFANWSSHGYGGGFHAWQPGYSVADTMNSIRTPFADQDIHIVGEAFSEWQGWVEGALATTEVLLNDLVNH